MGRYLVEGDYFTVGFIMEAGQRNPLNIIDMGGFRGHIVL
jgi:hypothetical protein